MVTPFVLAFVWWRFSSPEEDLENCLRIFDPGYFFPNLFQFAHAAMLVQRWDFEIESQQGDHDCKNHVAECLNPRETQLALRKTP